MRYIAGNSALLVGEFRESGIKRSYDVIEVLMRHFSKSSWMQPSEVSSESFKKIDMIYDIYFIVT